jgi:hypothetical protein
VSRAGADRQSFHLFSSADAAKLPEKILYGRFGLAVVVLIGLFLLAKFSFGEFGEAGLVQDREGK